MYVWARDGDSNVIADLEGQDGKEKRHRRHKVTIRDSPNMTVRSKRQSTLLAILTCLQDLSYCYLHMSPEKIEGFDFRDHVNFPVFMEADGEPHSCPVCPFSTRSQCSFRP